MRTQHKKIAAIAAIPALAIGWALFRPELLFVNHSVNETLNETGKQVSTGTFTSYAHETSGDAKILNLKGQSILRLSNFKTSNGPDVHVIISKTSDPKAFDAKSGIDLGVIKGNVGDQNYVLPAGTSAEEFKSVTIWCKRFAVSFGGATLAGAKMVEARTQITPTVMLASFGSEIRVTSGKLQSNGKTLGNSELIERDGERFLRIRGFKVPSGVTAEVYLVKTENLPKTFDFSKLSKIKYGSINAKKSENIFKISKDIDAWLYRSVIVWDSKHSKPLATAALRSDQEIAPKTLS